MIICHFYGNRAAQVFFEMESFEVEFRKGVAPSPSTQFCSSQTVPGGNTARKKKHHNKVENECKTTPTFFSFASLKVFPRRTFDSACKVEL